MRDVVVDTREVSYVLDSARRFGLAMPFQVCVTRWDTTLFLREVEDWRAWASYLSGDGDPIDVEVRTYEDRDHLRLTGKDHDFPLEVVVMAPAGEGQAHASWVLS